MNVSRDLFPWSVIIPHLEQQSTRAHEAILAEHAASLIKLWQDTTRAFGAFNETKISMLTEGVGLMLSKLAGATRAREMVLQALEAARLESTPGSPFWRDHMLLAGMCLVDKETSEIVFGSVGASDDDQFRLRWIKECTILTGFRGEISVLDNTTPLAVS